ncbi:hypothetical protein JK232_07340 [Nissabacter archeti]|uniref:DUF8093 domain-containing protein n=1 Tax=Nissabacter archeti TaxID=1917880 RepID=A0ABS5JFI9_9GAMM|nr:hypothetical protein [Nissabacter archeti]MBS0968705.1 hypothetical protein [Nissabacter archeti]
MFKLYRTWDLERELVPEDFQFIQSPDVAFRNAAIFYELDYLKYPYRVSPHEVPERKKGLVTALTLPAKRKYRSYYDGLYDDTQRNLNQGWIVGVDTDEPWDHFTNPFYFDDNGDLIYDCFMDHYCSIFEEEVRRAYEKCVHYYHRGKPAPTVKRQYGEVPRQYTQAAKTLNSKNVGRLLAVGGIYNGNIDGFRETASQLGGEAPEGFTQILNEKTVGTAIALASVAAGLGVGRIGAANRISQHGELHFLGKVEGEYSAINPGPLSERLAETFSGGIYKEIVLSENTIFFRAGFNGTALGRFFSYEKPLSIIQARIDKALLPKWPDGGTSPLDSFYQVEIPAGTKIYVGDIGYQNGFYMGGTEQVVIPAPWNIPGIKVIENGGLK